MRVGPRWINEMTLRHLSDSDMPGPRSHAAMQHPAVESQGGVIESNLQQHTNNNPQEHQEATDQAEGGGEL
jgi:hypothetical protein